MHFDILLRNEGNAFVPVETYSVDGLEGPGAAAQRFVLDNANDLQDDARVLVRFSQSGVVTEWTVRKTLAAFPA